MTPDERQQMCASVGLVGDRFREVCPSCTALGYGNMTCSTCVRQWPRFGISQDSVDQLLAKLGDRLPEPPLGATFQ